MLKSTEPTVLITGAARRIGAAIGNYFHGAGFRVVIHYHHSETAALELINRMNRIRPNSALALSADLCDSKAALPLIQKTLTWAGRLDVLVNNASYFSNNNAEWLQLFTLNVQAPFWLSHAAFAALVETEGVIINLTDTHASRPLKNYAIYCQSKAALAMQTQALAVEFAPKVRVNAVAPGAIIWPEGDNTLTLVQQQKIINKTLLKRHGQPLFIAQAVHALATNPFITGQTLCVDGGRGL